MLIIITPPHALPDEECIVNKLFESGLHLLHLRKPGADRETLERYIRGIRPRFRERVILHDHFELAEEYGLRGIHLKYNEARTFTGRNRFAHVSVSCHSFEEIDALPFEPNYVFLSPVLGLEGYRKIMEACRKEGIYLPVHAIGGIREDDIQPILNTGITGIALSSLLKNSEDITGKTRETMEQLKIKELPPPFGVLPL